MPFPVGPVGPVGTSSPSDLDSDGLVAWLGGCPHLIMGPTVSVGSSCCGDVIGGTCSWAPWGLITVTGTDCMASKDPVITQLPADGPVGDNRDVVYMNVTMNNCSVAPDVSDSCAVVAMVGLDTVRRREEAPMNCDDECAELDICNEFETIDGMLVYYGGDLYDSDGSEWDDPWDLAYA